MTENYTALYEEHKKLGASFTDFGGWQMPLKYSSELAEHHAVRNSAGLLAIFHGPRRVPSPVIRTSTLRRRCRSMPTTCRPS